MKIYLIAERLESERAIDGIKQWSWREDEPWIGNV